MHCNRIMRMLGRSAAAALVLGSAAQAEPGVTSDRILFGQPAPLTGPAAALGLEMRVGLLAAFAEVNNAGGIHGRRLELISQDDGYEPLRSIEAARRLLEQEKVFALAGPVGTATSAATQPIAAEAGAPFIAPFTGVEFLRRPFKPNVVNIRASYWQEAEAVVERLTKDRGFTRIGVLFQNDAFGRNTLSGIKQALTRRGLSVAAEASYERNSENVADAIAKIGAAKPEAVMLIATYKPCAAFIRQAQAARMDTLLVTMSFVGANALVKDLGAQAAGVVVSQIVPVPTDTSRPLVARYQAALRLSDPSAKPGFISFEGYIAGRVIAAALEKVPGEPTRKAMLDTVMSSSFDLDGLTLTYGPNDNQGLDEIFLTVIQQDGSFKPVASLAPAGG